MKHPQLKNARSGSHGSSEISSFVHESPPSVEIPRNVSISSLAGSLRLSNQTANASPVVGSTTIHGKNWSPPAAPPESVTLTVPVSDHVAPKSSEVWTEMSAFETVRSMLFWYTNSSRSRVGSETSEGDIGARAFLFGRRSWVFGLSANWPGLSIRTGAEKLAPASVERLKKNARSKPVLQSSRAYATSSAPVSSTTGIAHWFADAPTPLDPGSSGTTAVCVHVQVSGSPTGSVVASWTGQKSLRPDAPVMWNLMKVMYSRP